MSHHGPQDRVGAPYPGHHAGAVDPSDRSMAVLAHLSTLIGALLTGGWLVVLGPLVMWLVYKDRSPFVRQAAAGAFNFAIWLNVLSILAWVLFLSLIGIPLSLILFVAAGVGSVVVPILAAVAANRGERYGYPLTPALLR